ncbi:MAG: hypothetical protein E7B59_04320 [Enterobacteriaceae bacterium]|nr:hypothetical protein [Enterobacteriaceae bacterium]
MQPEVVFSFSAVPENAVLSPYRLKAFVISTTWFVTESLLYRFPARALAKAIKRAQLSRIHIEPGKALLLKYLAVNAASPALIGVLFLTDEY